MTCLRFPAGAPVAADDAASGNTGVGLHTDPTEPIRLLVADDDARVRAAIGQTISLEAGLVVVAAAADAAAALAWPSVLARRWRWWTCSSPTS